MEFWEIVEMWQDQNNVHRYEGESGLDHLNKLASDLGYEKHGFKYGSALEVFLADNPGAQEAIVEWIQKNGSNEWEEALTSDLNFSEDEEE